MPIIFTKEEIKEFLIDQGYDVEDEAILKKFIHDLKKLIKYEEMKKRRRKLGHPAEETLLDSTDNRTATTDSSNYRYERVEVEYDESRTYSSRSRSQHHDGHDKGHDHDIFDGSSRIKSSTPRKANHPRRPQSAVAESRSQQYRQPSRSRSSERTVAKPTNIRNQHNHQGRLPSEYEKQGGKREIGHNEGGRKAREPSRPAGHNKILSRKKTGVVMKRYTAATDDNGESVIYETDVSLSRQPKSRPQTASNFDKQPHLKGSNGKRQPASSSKQTDNADKDEPSTDPDCIPREPDELFHAIKELVFQQDDIENDDDSLFSEESRRRKLLKPPPHVARDPVSLFHWYKKYNWDIYSVPGEDRHMQLRWNVRAKTVGGYHPCVEVPIPPRPAALCGC